ncbi:MAG TPA: hypothetical protein EYP19_03415 [Desulfobacterales bacterium]|nr:hypothetical protein [Desulfobacterales bacterium]
MRTRIHARYVPSKIIRAVNAILVNGAILSKPLLPKCLKFLICLIRTLKRETIPPANGSITIREIKISVTLESIAMTSYPAAAAGSVIIPIIVVG